jgi:hypothetical protein
LREEEKEADVMEEKEGCAGSKGKGVGAEKAEGQKQKKGKVRYRSNRTNQPTELLSQHARERVRRGGGGEKKRPGVWSHSGTFSISSFEWEVVRASSHPPRTV